MNFRHCSAGIFATFLVLCSTGIEAASWRSADVVSIELRANVDRPLTEVTLRAELASPDFVFLKYLTLSYGDTVIEVPREILELLREPYLDKIELGYCCEGIFSGGEPDQPDHPNVMVTIPFYDEAIWEPRMGVAKVNETIPWPYVSLDFRDGRLSGYELWKFVDNDGQPESSDWNVRIFELEDGSFVEAQ